MTGEKPKEGEQAKPDKNAAPSADPEERSKEPAQEEGSKSTTPTKKKEQDENPDYRNDDGNKITFIMVGTKSDKVFENLANFDTDDDQAKG